MIFQLCVHREAFFMLGSDVSYLFSAETKKPLDAETPLLSDPRYTVLFILTCDCYQFLLT